jgi:Cu/Ag efflux pump CusA
VIAGDLPGHEIEHPMAIVILGGLLSSTFLSLVSLQRSTFDSDR